MLDAAYPDSSVNGPDGTVRFEEALEPADYVVAYAQYRSMPTLFPIEAAAPVVQVLSSSPEPVSQGPQKHNHRNDPIHGEEGSIQSAQVVRFDETVLPSE